MNFFQTVMVFPLHFVNHIAHNYAAMIMTEIFQKNVYTTLQIQIRRKIIELPTTTSQKYTVTDGERP